MLPSGNTSCSESYGLPLQAFQCPLRGSMFVDNSSDLYISLGLGCQGFDPTGLIPVQQDPPSRHQGICSGQNQDFEAVVRLASVTELLIGEGQQTPVSIAFFTYSCA